MKAPETNPFAPPAERSDQTERRVMTPTRWILLIALASVLFEVLFDYIALMF